VGNAGITPDHRYFCALTFGGMRCINLSTLEEENTLPELQNFTFSHNGSFLAGESPIHDRITASGNAAIPGEPSTSRGEGDVVVRTPFHLYVYHRDGDPVADFPLFRRTSNEIYDLEVHPGGTYVARAAFRDFSLWSPDGSLVTSFHIGDTDDVLFPEIEFTPDGKYCAFTTDNGYTLLTMDGKEYMKKSGETIVGTMTPGSCFVTKKGDTYEMRRSLTQPPFHTVVIPSAYNLLVDSSGALGISRDFEPPALYDMNTGEVLVHFPGIPGIMDAALSERYILLSRFTDPEFYENNVVLFTTKGNPEKMFYGGKYSSIALHPRDNTIAIGTDPMISWSIQQRAAWSGSWKVTQTGSPGLFLIPWNPGFSVPRRMIP
jgi:hypothetical protein